MAAWDAEILLLCIAHREELLLVAQCLTRCPYLPLR